MYSEDISIHRTQLHNQRYQNEEQKLRYVISLMDDFNKYSA